MYDLDLSLKGTLTAASSTGIVAGSVVSLGTLNGDGTFSYKEWRGISTVSVKITGTFTATAQFEASLDGTNWDAILGVPKGGGAAVSSATAAGTWFFAFAGYRYFRVRCSAYTSAPTVTVAGFVAAILSGASNAASALSIAANDPTTWVLGTPAVITDNSAHDVIAADASLRYYITDITITNSHATQGTLVTLKDGSGGSVLWQGYAAAAGGGFDHSFGIPLQTTAATALSAICGTTGSSIYICARGFKAA